MKNLFLLCSIALICLVLGCSQPPEPPKAQTLQEKIEKYLPNGAPTQKQFSEEIETIINKAVKKGYDWSDCHGGIGKEIKISFNNRLSSLDLFRPINLESQSMLGLVQLQVYNNDDILSSIICLTDDCCSGDPGLSKVVRTYASQDECDYLHRKIIQTEVNKDQLAEINKIYFACLRYISEEIL